MSPPVKQTQDPFEAGYSEIIDVRSPAEYAEDHIPGAINLPSLSNEERATVGTIYKQVSTFEARKIGAALVFANLSRHLENHYKDKPRDYKPLIYCWRGGQRSGSVATVLAMVGWQTTQLDGGYKRYRKQVLSDLEIKPAQFDLRIVGGKTGSAKTDILLELERRGEQIIDLEGLAQHRGSLLGAIPGKDQPSQKLFDSLVLQKLNQLDPVRPVWIEAESAKVGQVYVPKALTSQMRSGHFYNLQAPLDWRIAYLAKEYAHLNVANSPLPDLLSRLVRRHSHATINDWITQFSKGDWPGVVKNLLVHHYDPSYGSSSDRKFGERGQIVDPPVPNVYSVSSMADSLLKLV